VVYLKPHYIMAYSKAKLNNDCNRASSCFKPFVIGSMSGKFLPISPLLQVSFRHIFISLYTFMGIPNWMRILHETSFVTES